MSKVLVIIPTYNEEATIIQLIDKLLNLPLDLDILVIDDGNDKTEMLVKEKQLSASNVSLFKRQTKSGRGSAVLAGLKIGLEREYDYLVEMDADFSHQPDELPELIKLADLKKVVIASRYVKGSRIVNWPFSRRLFSRLANFYASLILRVGIHDYTNGYRVYGRQTIEKLNFEKIRSRGYIVLSEIAYQLFKQGSKFVERKTLFVNRSRGNSNFSWQEVKEAFFSIIKFRCENK